MVEAVEAVEDAGNVALEVTLEAEAEAELDIVAAADTGDADAADIVEADADVLAATTLARHHAEVAVAAAVAEVSALQEERAELTERLEAVAEMRAHATLATNAARVATARAMLFKPALEEGGLSAEQLLRVIPDADPTQPGGLAAWENWRRANVTMFRSVGVDPRSVVNALRDEVDGMGNGLFSSAKLMRSVWRT